VHPGSRILGRSLRRLDAPSDTGLGNRGIPCRPEGSGVVFWGLSYSATENHATGDVLNEGSSVHVVIVYASYALCRGGGKDEGSAGV